MGLLLAISQQSISQYERDSFITIADCEQMLRYNLLFQIVQNVNLDMLWQKVVVCISNVLSADTNFAAAVINRSSEER